jgi:alkaline phosphatase D
MPTLSRRQLLSGAGALATLALTNHSLAGFARARTRFSDHPFKLGVASGDPLPDGVVLWTRLAPDPLSHNGGMGPDPVTVSWEVAEDERMRRIVQKGSAVAAADLAHSVHVELRGLKPARWYWYRFRAGNEVSPVARTRTAPRPDARLGRLRFAFASCQNWEFGHYAAYHHMLADDLDLIVHLGDYIYETSSKNPPVRRHDLPEARDLDGYRRRHALYKTDADLQAAHAACPWIVTWDDHEVSNDYANDHSERREDPQDFLRRRAGAYQAYYEHMPLRRSSLPQGPEMRLYRDLGWGTLASFFVLDGRQYRAVQACGEGRPGGGQLVTSCAARFDAAQTYLGDTQERWLFDGLGRAQSRWTVLAQQQLMGQLRQRSRGGEEAYWTDGWDGYAGARQRMLAQLRDRRVLNPVVIGGDIHSFWVTDLKVDYTESAPVVATEFVGTSISSSGIPYDRVARLLPDNPHVRFFDSRPRGYVRCTVSPERWLTELRALESPADPRSPVNTLATFLVESGRPGAQRI